MRALRLESLIVARVERLSGIARTKLARVLQPGQTPLDITGARQTVRPILEGLPQTLAAGAKLAPLLFEHVLFTLALTAEIAPYTRRISGLHLCLLLRAGAEELRELPLLSRVLLGAAEFLCLFPARHAKTNKQGQQGHDRSHAILVARSSLECKPPPVQQPRSAADGEFRAIDA